MKKTILAVTTDPFDNVYGFSLVFQKLFNYLAENYPTLKIKIICNDGKNKNYLLESFPKFKDNYKVIKFRRSTLMINGLLFVGGVLKVIRKFKNNEIIIITNSELPELVTACIMQSVYKMNVYSFVHDIFPADNRRFGKYYNVFRLFLLKRIKNIIVLNDYLKEYIKNKIPESNCAIIPNPIIIYEKT